MISKRIYRTIACGTSAGLMLHKMHENSIKTFCIDDKSNTNRSNSWYWGGDYAKWLYGHFVYSSENVNIVDDNLHFKAHSTAGSEVNTKRDGLMTWPSFVRGLQRRNADEKENGPKLQALIVQAQNAIRNNASKQQVDDITLKIAEIVYGVGQSAETRQRYLELYGCAAYTDEALRMIVASTSTSVLNTTPRRGILEMGAGNGQWARQLTDRYKIDMMAFDNMTSVPLRVRGGAGTPSAATPIQTDITDCSYFRPVREGSETVLTNWQRITQFGLQDRVLMIIFPDPTDMAIKTLRNYVALVEKKGSYDPVFVYVGEGRGGANGNHQLFDELENPQNGWKLEGTCALSPFGDKGYERLFVFRKKRGAVVDK